MNGFRSIFARELRRRRLPLVAAALLGLLAIATPWLPGVSTDDPAGLASLAAMTAAALWMFALAVLEGSRFLVADLREGRLAWDLRLPVSTGAIWGGRLAAALVNLFGGAFLCVLPALVAGVDPADLSPRSVVLPRLPSLGVEDPAWLVAAAALCALFLLNRLALAAAARTWRGALDLVVLALLKAAAIQAVYMLWRASADRSTVRVALLALAASAVALGAASFAQVGSGRSELVPAERAASIRWIVLAPVVALFLLAWSWRILHPPLRALVDSPLASHPLEEIALSGDLVWISGSEGREPGLVANYLVSRSDGRRRFAGSSYSGFPGNRPSTSLDRSFFAWIEIERVATQRWELTPVTQSLSDIDAPRTRSAIVWGSSPFAWTLTGDGRSVASLWPRHRMAGSEALDLIVENLESGRRIRSIRLPECRSGFALEALDRTRVRFTCGSEQYRGDAPRFVLDIDLSTGAGHRVEPSG